MALLTVACSDAPKQPQTPPAPDLVEAPALPESSVYAAPPATATVRPTPSVSAIAPELPPIDVNDEGDLRVVTGFSRPSAVLFDPKADCYLVSNLGGGAEGREAAYIAKIDPEGEMLEARFIDGAARGVTLNQPRAMVIRRNRLYVADGAHIRVFDRRSGVRRGVIRIPGATQLSGLALDTKGGLLVTDAAFDEAGRPMRSDAVYRVNRAGRPSSLFRSSVLGHPVGVVRLGSTVWIATGGSGKLYGLQRDGQLLEGPTLDEGRLSGLVEIGSGEVVVTSRAASGVYRGDLNGDLTYVQGGISEPGHPAWDPTRRRLLVPSEDTGELRVIALDP